MEHNPGQEKNSHSKKSEKNESKDDEDDEDDDTEAIERSGTTLTESKQEKEEIEQSTSFFDFLMTYMIDFFDLIAKKYYQGIENVKSIEEKENNNIHYKKLIEMKELKTSNMRLDTISQIFETGRSSNDDDFKLDKSLDKSNAITRQKTDDLFEYLQGKRLFRAKEISNIRFLEKQLLNAQKLQPLFKNEINEIVNKIAPFAKINVGPIKSKERCLIKCKEKYYKQKHPTTACITDIIRAEVIVNTIKDFVIFIESFKQYIDSNKSKYIPKILRHKPNTKEIHLWNDESHGKYIDDKFNIIFYDKESAISLIGEIQVLLSIISQIKPQAHIVYDIEREKYLMDDINNQMFKLHDKIAYHRSTLALAVENNKTQLIRRAWHDPLNFYSIAVRNGKGHRTRPLLSSIRQSISPQLSMPLVHGLLYFSTILYQDCPMKLARSCLFGDKDSTFSFDHEYMVCVQQIYNNSRYLVCLCLFLFIFCLLFCFFAVLQFRIDVSGNNVPSLDVLENILSKSIVNDNDNLIEKGLELEYFTSSRGNKINEHLIRLFAKYLHKNQSVQFIFNQNNVNDATDQKMIDIWQDALNQDK